MTTQVICQICIRSVWMEMKDVEEEEKESSQKSVRSS